MARERETGTIINYDIFDFFGDGLIEPDRKSLNFILFWFRDFEDWRDFEKVVEATGKVIGHKVSFELDTVVGGQAAKAKRIMLES